MDLRDAADRLWRGEDPVHESNPLSLTGELSPVADGVAFAPTFGNVSLFDTDDGLVMVDTGSQMTADWLYTSVRAWSDKPLHTAIYTHGHIDHVFGVGPFDREADERGWARPHVVGHRNVVPRFERYVLTAGYNQTINRRQFGVDNLVWPVDYRFPDETYEEELELRVGGQTFHLRHEMGETDDATVVWFPAQKVLCTGDLFIWTSPNCGNPQKVQRYPREWAEALRRMAALSPEYLLPGHGLPIFGADRVRQALLETAEYLESLFDQTIELINQGARLSDILSAVAVPAHLAEREYLRPYYDEPEFIVRNLWRRYAGWWDGNPANLKPANDRAFASQVCELAGGPAALAARAESLLERGDDEGRRLAGQLVEVAWLAAPDDNAIGEARARVYGALAAAATSTMSRGVYRWAQRESARSDQG